MSEFLLDTHTLLYWDSEPERLGDRARALLRREEHTFHVSHASIWEIAIKSRLGKLTLPGPLDAWVNEAVTGNGFALVPIDLDAILGTTRLPMNHGDPFDRLLIAQALSRHWTVLGSDAQWDAYGVVRVWT